MYACYIDESGDTGALPASTSPIQPVLCILGVTLDLTRLPEFTSQFIDLKARFFPRLFPGPRIGRILVEIKGSDLRSVFRSTSADARKRHHHIGFLQELLNLLTQYDCKIFGRVWVKPIGGPMNGWSTYTSSAQAICTVFHNYLTTQSSTGILICDSRLHHQNARVSHSIFTQKFRAVGDPYSRIVEMPTFSHSENHAGLQVCDILASALIYPITTFTCCTGHVTNLHVDPGFQELKTRFGQTLNTLQYRYQEYPLARYLGGITLSDPLGRKNGGHLFR